MSRVCDLYLDANKGADYITIEEVDEDFCIIEVGQCCVVHGAYRVPKAWIIAMFANPTKGYDEVKGGNVDILTEIKKSVVKEMGEFTNKEYVKKLVEGVRKEERLI